MVTCERINCGYFYKDINDLFPCCHFPSNDPFSAPCEVDDDYFIEDDDDLSYYDEPDFYGE